VSIKLFNDVIHLNAQQSMVLLNL